MINSKQGLRKHASSPASIANNQHHDPSGSQKSANGVPGTVREVVATSTNATNIENYAMLWVVNRNAATQYILATRSDLLPGAITASNGMAIPPTPADGMLIMCGASDDPMLSMAVRTSSADVHVTVLEV